MITNKEIARAFKLCGALMELHDENPFKIKSFQNAAFKIDKLPQVLAEMDVEALEKIDGIGKGLSHKIRELAGTGSMNDLTAMLEKTPAGVVEMLGIKGIGPKKVATIWKELDVESIGELLYACNENRLVDLKGFGAKTQEQVKQSIEYLLSSSGKFHFAAVEGLALKIVEDLQKSGLCANVSLTGAIRRKCEIIETIEIIVGCDSTDPIFHFFEQHPQLKPETLKTSDNSINAVVEGEVPLMIKLTKPDDFSLILFETTASAKHLSQIKIPENLKPSSEKEIYAACGVAYIEPELREGLGEVALAKENKLPVLIDLSDLKGILHNHSTYSDGMHNLEEMATYCKQLGYEYFGICDHSQSAFYANGLKPERVLAQHQEIDTLNRKLAPFRILKGIESDILSDGSLDYEEEILKTFDIVVASVHSNLKMTEEKAMQRLIKAIENPYTTILGHPTGRLLLARPGYPINHQKIIDACAANNVVIELNAHPYRLDLDWRWIQYAIEKDVMISINPDAHKKEGFHDMYYGVCVARKGMLTKKMTFNALSLREVLAKLKRS